MLKSKIINPKLSTLPPRPLNNEPTPNVESPFDPRGINQSNAPLSIDFKRKISHFLPPPPRDQIEDPGNNVKPASYFLNTPYDTKTCTYKYHPKQKVKGLVCNYTGNANFVRGNQFSNDFKNLYDSERYTVEQPVLEPTNPLMVSSSPFYPFPGFEFRINPYYKTYPYSNDYLGTMPAYRNPYNTQGPNSPIVEKFAALNESISTKKHKKHKKQKKHTKEIKDKKVETFQNKMTNENCALAVIGMAAVIIVVTMAAK